MDTVGEVVRGLVPTLGVSLLFAAAIWAIVRADAAERAGRARVEAEEDRAAAEVQRAAADEQRAGAQGDRAAAAPSDDPEHPRP